MVNLLLYSTEILGLLALVALLLRVRVNPAVGWIVAGLGIAAAVVRTALYPPESWDFEIFWKAGCALEAGGDPYQLGGGLNPPLNPPTALPLFAAFATVPYETALMLWAFVNVLGCAFLVVLARQVLLAQEGSEGWSLSATATAVLTGVVVFAPVCRFGIDAGQLSVLTALALLAALQAQARGRPLWAGAFLAVGTIKTATMLPFLLLFHRKKDLPAWFSLGVVSLGLCLLGTAPEDLLARCHTCLEKITELSQPGRANDYSYSNRAANDIIAFDHLFYRLGLRERAVIKWAQLGALALLGAWVLWQVSGRSRLSRPAACALVACYSALFLYHRYYDLVILVLPLVYCTGRALSVRDRSRWLYVLSVCSVLAVLSLRRNILDHVSGMIDSPGAGNRLLEALVLPFGAWWTLIALFALAAAERCRQRLSRDTRLAPA